MRAWREDSIHPCHASCSLLFCMRSYLPVRCGLGSPLGWYCSGALFLQQQQQQQENQNPTKFPTPPPIMPRKISTKVSRNSVQSSSMNKSFKNTLNKIAKRSKEKDWKAAFTEAQRHVFEHSGGCLFLKLVLVVSTRYITNTTIIK